MDAHYPYAAFMVVAFAAVNQFWIHPHDWFTASLGFAVGILVCGLLLSPRRQAH